MLLIHPPVAKPSEPPAGIAKLAGFMRSNGIACRVLDANIEGLLHLLQQPVAADDTWTRRAVRSRADHLDTLRRIETCRSPDRYGRAVRDLNRLVSVAGRGAGTLLGLSDCQHERLSPLRSDDLLLAAEHPERDPFFGWFSRRLPEVAAEGSGVSTIGFSLNYLSQALSTFAMIGYVRKTFPCMTIVVGGGLATSWLRRPGWSNPFAGLIDHLIAGPGELPLLALAGKAADCDGVATPDYTGLPLHLYLSPGFVLPYSAASGCWWNRCSFCPERAEGSRYRPVPMRRALTELQELTARLHPSLVHLLDNAVSPAMLQGVVENPPGAPWYGFARFSDRLADMDFCMALKRSGCVMLKLGLESGDQGVLDRLQKGIDLRIAVKVLENLRMAGIGVYLYLLFGTPAETEQDARRTVQFVARYGENIGFLNCALFNMPAGGDEARELATHEFYEGDLSLYTGFRHPQGWERKQVRRFMTTELSRNPAVAAILRRDPPVFTSNHAPFFVGNP